MLSEYSFLHSINYKDRQKIVNRLKITVRRLVN